MRLKSATLAITLTTAAMLAAAASGCMGGTSRGMNATASDVRAGAVSSGPAAGVRLVGRFDLRDAAGPRFAWPATAIEARFTGTTLDARLGQVGQMLYNGVPTHPYFDVSIDGGTPTSVTFVAAPGLTHLADNLGAGVHTVRLTRISEANQGVAQFMGFVIGGGGSLADPPGARPHALEFVGDSGATGYGATGTNGVSCQQSGETEDSDRAYPAYVAAMLDADFATEAFSGKGISRNLSAADPVKTLPVLFDRILPDDPSSSWDFGRYTPDAVIVDAGGNDLDGDSCHGQVASASGFVSTYVAFLQHIHAVYPNAQIVVALTTSGCAADRTTLDGLLQQVTTAATGAGLPVTYAPFPAYDPSWGLGCDAHPTAVGARHLAESLAPVLKAQLGW